MGWTDDQSIVLHMLPSQSENMMMGSSSCNHCQSEIYTEISVAVFPGLDIEKEIKML